MLEVCERFGMRIDEYRALPPGEKALYGQYALVKLEEAASMAMAMAAGTAPLRALVGKKA